MSVSETSFLVLFRGLREVGFLFGGVAVMRAELLDWNESMDRHSLNWEYSRSVWFHPDILKSHSIDLHAPIGNRPMDV